MSENLRDFTKAVYGFDAVVRRAPASAWTSPSACEGWTGADVVAHFLDVAGMVITMASDGATVPPTPTGDPAADWAATRDALLASVDEPGALQREDDTPFGRMSVDRLIGILAVDPLCHTFDLAVAAGVDPALDDALVERCHGHLRKAGDMIRLPGMFGPEVEAPADATPAEAFLAFAGRNPRP